MIDYGFHIAVIDPARAGRAGGTARARRGRGSPASRSSPPTPGWHSADRGRPGCPAGRSGRRRDGQRARRGRGAGRPPHRPAAAQGRHRRRESRRGPAGAGGGGATARVAAYAAGPRRDRSTSSTSPAGPLSTRCGRPAGPARGSTSRPGRHTCTWTPDRYRLPDRQGNKYVCWPPLREADDQEALWEGLESGEIQTYATDHTTWMAGQKMDPSLSFARDTRRRLQRPDQHRDALRRGGRERSRISMTTFVAVTADEPGEAVRPVAAQGQPGGRLGRRPRGHRPGAAVPGHRTGDAFAIGLRPVRGL